MSHELSELFAKVTKQLNKHNVLLFQEYVFFPLLSTCAALTSPSHVIVSEGWKEPITLWTLLTAGRASRKSAVIRQFAGEFRACRVTSNVSHEFDIWRLIYGVCYGVCYGFICMAFRVSSFITFFAFCVASNLILRFVERQICLVRFV